MDKIQEPIDYFLSTWDQKFEIVFLRKTAFKIIVESRDKKIKCSLFNSVGISKYDYGHMTDSFEDQ